MFPGCYKIHIGISASGPNSRCHQQNKIRLNDVSLNCVIICHALIQYTHLFLKCLRCMIFIGATQHYMNPSRATIPFIRPHQCDSDGGRIRGVLLYYHKITEYGIKCCMHAHLEVHVHRQAGVNAKLYFWTIFQFFFYPNGTWTHPPTSKLFLEFF